MRFAIGITIHNEERNIGILLERLRAEAVELGRRGLERIYVVSSGSTDRSDSIVGEIAADWPLVELIVEAERRGKASAINRFIQAAGDVDHLVLMSGDVLPEPGAIGLFLDALAPDDIGMVAGRPTPTGDAKSLIDRVVRLQWDLHHEVSLRAPKLGEAVAFRNVLPDGIPLDTAVDEASLEQELRDRGYRFAYVPEAVIFNKGPQTIADFLKQRRRIAAGHNHLAETRAYKVSTTRPGIVLPAVAGYLVRRPWQLPVVAAAAALELYGRFLGFVDLRIRGRNPYVWDIATSTKDPERP